MVDSTADATSVEHKEQGTANVSDGSVEGETLDSNALSDMQGQEHISPLEAVEEPLDAQAEYEEDEVYEEYEAYGEEDFEKPRRRFVPPTREQLLNWLPFVCIILLGAILRFWGLGDKPLHHDESLHAYFSLQLLHNLQDWSACFTQTITCYQYNPLLHGPFQFHAIALVYQISQWLGAPDHGVNTTTVRIAAATLGTGIVALPYFLRDYLGKVGALLACFFLAVSPSMVYFSRFAREDIYFAFFTFLFIVGTARYLRERKLRWLITAATGFAFAYATKESIFLEIAIFGSFLGALIVWELGLRWSVRSRFNVQNAKLLPRTGAPIFLALYFIILAPIAKVLFAWMKNLSIYITNPKNTTASDLYVANLKANTVAIIPWLGILLGIYVLSILAREMMGKLPPQGKRNFIARRINPNKQTLLDTIFTMPWTHWFFAILCAWTIFLVLFTVLFTNIRGGIGDGIWQGLYYWLQQQEVARGGQPWYYYLMLIPLYEQVGLVFGIVGVVRCLLRPTRFRLFLVYWFVGSVFIYSWAAEKMPWLMIHMTMPMMVLAGIGLEPAVMAAYNYIKQRMSQQQSISPILHSATHVSEQDALGQYRPVPVQKPKRIGVLAGSGAIATIVMALLLLAPTLHNMYEVSYVHAADGPHEMMVYVQTTTDVNTVMAKVDALDQKYDNGSRNMPIGLTNDATWPFAWYVRDYTNVCFNYPDGCPAIAKNIPVIIVGGDNLYSAEVQYTAKVANSPTYAFHQYKMRTWWDEGYKPTPCVVTKTNTCADQPTYGGVGLGLWLSYGDNPPVGAKFNLARAANNIWQWWWQRKAIGSTDGAYDMGLFIRSDLQTKLGVNP